MYSELNASILTECEWCNTRYRIAGSNNIEIGLTKARCKRCNKIFTINLASYNDVHQQKPKEFKKRTSTFQNSRSVQNSENYNNIRERGLTVHENSNEKSKSVPKSDTIVKFGIRKKFNAALAIIMIVSLCATYMATNSLFKQSAEHSARFLMYTMEASRAFTGEVLKPVLYKELPGRFIVEGMSSSFGARNLFERIKKKYPDYYFKHAAPNPRNKLNLADDFEKKIIEKFKKNPNLKEWHGYRGNNTDKDFVIMKPILAEERCMKCHSVPSKAPVEIIEKYGDKAAFGMVVGDVIAALTVSAPATKIFTKSRNNTIIVNIIIALCFISLIAIINIFFAKIVIKPIQRLKQSVNEISIGNMEVPINSNGNDEISDLALSFERMQVSICMAMQRLNRIRKEQKRLENSSNNQM
jgi:HAMP domain-containing protein